MTKLAGAQTSWALHSLSIVSSKCAECCAAIYALNIHRRKITNSPFRRCTVPDGRPRSTERRTTRR